MHHMRKNTMLPTTILPTNTNKYRTEYTLKYKNIVNLMFLILHVVFGVSMQAWKCGDIFLVYSCLCKTTTNEAQCTITLSKIFYVSLTAF